MKLNNRWILGISAISGAIISVASIRLIFYVLDVNDTGLVITFIALMSGSTSITIHEAMRRKLDTPESPKQS